MPITEELNNLRKFESVGFTHEQSEILTDVIEKAQVSGQESLKEFIRSEFEKQNKDIDSKFKGVDAQFKGIDAQFKGIDAQFKGLDSIIDSRLYALEARLIASQKDLLIKMFAIITGTAGMLFAMLKLFG
jgi:hypothetical protein